MAMKLYSDASVQAIANAIRTKNGASTQYKIADMAPAILAIPTGSTVKTGTITPASRSATLSIDIGMTDINWFAILPVSENPLKSGGKTCMFLMFFKNPQPYYTRLVGQSNASGSAALAPGLSTSLLNYTMSGTTLTTPNTSYYFEAIEWRWYAW